jgi:hypothetical protein
MARCSTINPAGLEIIVWKGPAGKLLSSAGDRCRAATPYGLRWFQPCASRRDLPFHQISYLLYLHVTSTGHAGSMGEANLGAGILLVLLLMLGELTIEPHLNLRFLLGLFERLGEG